MAGSKGSLLSRLRRWFERLFTPSVRIRLAQIDEWNAAAVAQIAELQRRIAEQSAAIAALREDGGAASAALRGVEERMSAHQDSLSAVEARFAALEAELETPETLDHRVGFVERCLGLDGEESGETVPDGLERLLEMRLGQLETRILTYLEGPYYERVGGQPARTAEDAVVSRAANSLTAIAGTVTALHEVMNVRLAQIEQHLPPAETLGALADMGSDIGAVSSAVAEMERHAADNANAIASGIAETRQALQELETRVSQLAVPAGNLTQMLEPLIATVGELKADARKQDRLRLLERRAAMVRLDMDRGEPVPAVAPPAATDLQEQLQRLRELAPLNFDAWLERFEAGRVEYEKRDAQSLSTREHREAFHFRQFLAIYARGRVLDIGVGPLAVPSYLADIPLERLAGIDPLPPFEPHPFAFAQAVAESIPWPDASFETVVIATSLDHVYLLDVSLAEIERVLAPGGRLLIWTGIFPETAPYDPYAATIEPPDAFHLFHPGENWFPQFVESKFKLVERIDTEVIGYANALLAYEKR